MPRQTKFAIGSLIVSTSNPESYYGHQLYNGDIGKVKYDDYNGYHKVVVIHSSEPTFIELSKDYYDSYCREAVRADVINVIRLSAQKNLDLAQHNFKKLEIYQKFPTMDAELENLIAEFMKEDITEEEIVNLISKSSLSISNNDKLTQELTETLSRLKNWV